MELLSETFDDVEISFVRRKHQKHLRVRVKPDEVVVSAPRRTSRRTMEQFVRERRPWIEQSLNDLHRRRKQQLANLRYDEGYILLRGHWKPVEVRIVKAGGAKAVLRETDTTVVLSSREKPRHITVHELQQFYRRIAKNELKLRCRQLADEMGSAINRVYVRNQQTKWGSCSSKRNVSLNWRLVKCPEAVRDYLIIHELCHLKEMNHSKAFWSLVEQHMPDYKRPKSWLKKHEQQLFLEEPVTINVEC